MQLDYYYFPFSYWSRVISLLIEEKGLSPERHLVDIRTNANFAPDYMRLNPKGVVPTLVRDGIPVCNSPRIAEVLDEVCTPRLAMPTEFTTRLEAAPVMYFSYTVWTLGKKGEQSASILADKVDRAHRYAEKHPEFADEFRRKGAFFQKFSESLADDAVRARFEADQSQLLEDLSDHLRQRKWLAGAAFGYADALATSMLYRFADLEYEGLNHWYGNRDHPLQQYLDRASDRTSFQAVWKNDPLIASAGLPEAALPPPP